MELQELKDVLSNKLYESIYDYINQKLLDKEVELRTEFKKTLDSAIEKTKASANIDDTLKNKIDEKLNKILELSNNVYDKVRDLVSDCDSLEGDIRDIPENYVSEIEGTCDDVCENCSCLCGNIDDLGEYCTDLDNLVGDIDELLHPEKYKDDEDNKDEE